MGGNGKRNENIAFLTRHIQGLQAMAVQDWNLLGAVDQSFSKLAPFPPSNLSLQNPEIAKSKLINLTALFQGPDRSLRHDVCTLHSSSSYSKIKFTPLVSNHRFHFSTISWIVRYCTLQNIVSHGFFWTLLWIRAPVRVSFSACINGTSKMFATIHQLCTRELKF